MIRVSEVHLTEVAEDMVLQVLRSGRLAQGPMVEEFESRFSEVAGTPHAVAVTSGTTALVAAIQALGLEPGDEVITSPFTFVATLNAILEAGAIARFVDILPADFTIDPSLVEAVIGPATRAIMPVHLYGYPANMTRLAGIARKHGLALIEDAAQAIGATVDGRPVGSYGLGTFSFYATKNITTGEGGMVTTTDRTQADRLRLLRSQGMRDRYRYELAGHNYRMTEIQAAIGITELDRLEWVTARRRHNAEALSAGLIGLDAIRLPVEEPGRMHVYHQFTIRVTDQSRLDRDSVHRELAARGIESGVYYPSVVYDYECYRLHPRVKIESAPEAEQATREVLSLPVHQWLVPTDLDQIITTLADILEG